jgi:hypothetical protein
MPRPYIGPKLWLDPNRGTWTILDGRKRIRTGHAERDLAVVAIHQYTKGTYNPERPRGPQPIHKTEPRRGVYVLGFDQYVKIGITINLDMRLSGLQTPVEPTLYALIDGWRREELELHARFAAYRLRGEWFKKEGELAEWIANGCYPKCGRSSKY